MKGPSGAGKSTFLFTLTEHADNAIYRPNRRKILWLLFSPRICAHMSEDA
ncbi:MAG TPA: hypothetical protein DCS30_11685 [Rhizobiales bacterium]|nr:hypothetical protein [Hyphomicrobiales bacterium]